MWPHPVGLGPISAAGQLGLADLARLTAKAKQRRVVLPARTKQRRRAGRWGSRSTPQGHPKAATLGARRHGRLDWDLGTSSRRRGAGAKAEAEARGDKAMAGARQAGRRGLDSPTGGVTGQHRAPQGSRWKEQGEGIEGEMRVCTRWGSSAALKNDEEGCRVGLG